jgi:hypothetical protein
MAASGHTVYNVSQLEPSSTTRAGPEDKRVKTRSAAGPETAASVVAAGPLVPGVLDARQLVALQGAAGNRAVQRLMSGYGRGRPRPAPVSHPAATPKPTGGKVPAPPSSETASEHAGESTLAEFEPAVTDKPSVDVQLWTPPPTPPRSGALSVVQRAPNRPDQTANIAKLTELRANADQRFKLATDYSKGTLDVGDVVKGKLTILSNTYSEGYKTFRDVLDKAQQQAQNQQMWTDIIVGVAAGALAGLAAAFVLPSTAAGWFSLTLAEAGTALASSGGQGLLSGGLAAGASKLTNVEGKAISSEGLQPAFQELAMWKKVAEIYRSGLELTPMVQKLHELSGALGDRIGDLRVYQAGGQSDFSPARIKAMMERLTAPDTQLKEMQDQLTLKIVELANIKQAAASIDTNQSAQSMEKEIWQMWMATLPQNSNILDINAIENHIGPKGLKIVDFGSWWTTRADQNDAIDKAVTHFQFMKAEAAKNAVPSNPAANLRVKTLN